MILYAHAKSKNNQGSLDTYIAISGHIHGRIPPRPSILLSILSLQHLQKYILGQVNPADFFHSFLTTFLFFP